MIKVNLVKLILTHSVESQNVKTVIIGIGIQLLIVNPMANNFLS